MTITAELNRKIAEKFMGWELHGDSMYFYADGTGPVYIGNQRMTVGTWKPTEDWAHFGPVLGRVWERGNEIDLTLVPSGGLAPSITVWLDWGYRTIQQTDNPLEAACAAILEAWDDGRE